MPPAIQTAASSLSEDEMVKALQAYKELQAREAMKENAVAEYIQESQGTILFRYKWEELLGVWPLVINLLGACYIAASSQVGQSVTLTPLVGEFKHLSQSSLRANLLECGDIGSKAFSKTKPCMSHIELVSNQAYKTVNKILHCLQDDAAAKKLLNLNLNQLKRDVEDCTKSTRSVDKEFRNWLGYVCELHEATAGGDLRTTVKGTHNEAQLMVQESDFELNEQRRKIAAEVMDKMKGTLKDTEEAYKEAAGNLPLGWEAVAQQFVSGLAETVNNAINHAAPQLVQNYDPVAHGSTANAGNSTQGVSQVHFPEYNDPAYMAVATIGEIVTTLVSILTGGPGGDIDWDYIVVGQHGDQKTGLSYCRAMLAFSDRTFNPTENEPSVKLSEAIKTCIKVVAEIEAAAKGSSPSCKPPAPDSAQVRKWQEDVQTAYTTVTLLRSVACSTIRSRPPLLSDGNIPDAQEARGALANAILNAASDRLSRTQAMYMAAQENYQKAVEKQVEVVQRMEGISTELSKLRADDLTATEVNIILTKCLEALVTLKGQIAKFIQVFTAMSDIIEFVMKHHVPPFLEGIGSVEADSLNGFGVADMHRQILFCATIMIRTYFGVFRDVAHMYVQQSKLIEKGFDMLDQLSLEVQGNNTDVIGQKHAKLQEWTTTANQSIRAMVSQKQREIMEGMKGRVQAVADDSQCLPRPPQKQLKSVNEGKEMVTGAAEKGLRNYNPPGAFPMPDLSRVLAPK